MFIARVRLLKRRSRGAQYDSNGHIAPTERDSFDGRLVYKHAAPPELRTYEPSMPLPFKRIPQFDSCVCRRLKPRCE